MKKQSKYTFQLLCLLLTFVSCANPKTKIQAQESHKPNNLLFKKTTESVELLIDGKDLKNLKQKRRLALYDGHLYGTDDDWVDAKFVHRKDTMKAEVRLKGDFYDHWIDSIAWSFKVKLKGDNTFYGMGKFALQHYKTRGGLNEWLFHQLLKANDVMALRYDFLKVKVNGNFLPTYAIEENFDKFLVEHNERKEGVVFQLSNKYYWVSSTWHGNSSPIDSYFGSVLTPYQESSVVKDEYLFNQFKIARSLMTKFHRGELEAHQVFDIKKMARFYATVDLMGHHHACYNDNVKLYLNPLTSLIEPIGYDNQLILKINNQGLLGEKKGVGKLLTLTNPTAEDSHTKALQYGLLFKDKKFYRIYLQELNAIIADNRIDNIVDELESAINKRLALIQESDSSYSFKWQSNTIKYNARFIQDSILNLNEKHVSAQIVEQQNGAITIQFLNKKTLPVKVQYILINNDTIPVKEEFVLQSWMNKATPASLVLNYEKQVSGSIKAKLALYGLEQIQEVIEVNKSKNNWGNADNNLSVVPIAKVDFVNWPSKGNENELQERIVKEEKTPYVDSTLTGIQVYFKKYSKKDNTITVGITNVSMQVIELIDIRYHDKWIFKPLKKTYLQASYSNMAPYYEEVTFAAPSFRKEYPNRLEMDFPWKKDMLEELEVLYKHPGAINHKTCRIFPWPYFDNKLLADNLVRKEANATNFDFLIINEQAKIITIKPGKWLVSEGIKIPDGYLVKCGGNTTIDFTDNAFLLSYSPLQFNGDKDNRIKITSSDKTGLGLAVFGAHKESEINYVDFSNNKALDKYGMALTGMITFYESDVTINNCSFANNDSEDMLNIVRSKYSISNTTFNNIFSDALDADFSIGEIKQTTFENIGNDAIDISGRKVNVQDVTINNVSDKGLSAGENSILSGTNINISNTEIAVSAKDLSTIEIDKLILKSNALDFAVFQKKEEYGAAKVSVASLNKKPNYLLEKKSTLLVNGNKLEKTKGSVKNKLYGKEYGKSSK